MTPDKLEEILEGIDRAHRSGAAEAVSVLAIMSGAAKVSQGDAFDGGTFDFNQRFPLSKVRVPPRSTNEIGPEGRTFRGLEPYFERIKKAIEDGSPIESIDPPEGMRPAELVEAWRNLVLFHDSGAVLRQNTEQNIEVARVQIAERGTSSILVVLDEDYRVISGLPYVWALDQDNDEVAAAILHGAPQDAGWHHTHAEALKWGKTLWEKGVIQRALEESSPTEREFFQGFGFHQVPETTVLTLSWDTFERLSHLVTKQLGGNTKHDPAQLLFVEALRETVLTTRQRIIREGKNKKKDESKLQRHLDRENVLLAEGERIESENEWEWIEDESGLWFHPSLPRYRFRVSDPEPVEPASERAEAPARGMDASQFMYLARDHFGLDKPRAMELYSSDSDDNFDARLRRYVETVGPIDRRGPNGPTEKEQSNQADRLALWTSR